MPEINFYNIKSFVIIIILLLLQIDAAVSEPSPSSDPDSVSDTDSGPVAAAAGNDIEALGPTLARPMSSVSASTSTTACSGRPVRSRTTMRRPAPVIIPGSAARPRAATVAATVGRSRGRKRRAVSEPSSASDTDSEPAAAPQGRGRGLGRGRGRQARTVGGRRDAIDDGWRLLEGEESEATVPSWIMDFDDRNIGYRGDQDLSDADPIAFLQ